MRFSIVVRQPDRSVDQAGSETAELVVGQYAALVQLRQFAERPLAVRGRSGRGRRRGPPGAGGYIREGGANCLLSPPPALTPGEPCVDVVGASRDRDVADQPIEEGHAPTVAHSEHAAEVAVTPSGWTPAERSIRVIRKGPHLTARVNAKRR